MLFDGNNDDDVKGIFRASGDGTYYSKRVPYVSDYVGKGDGCGLAGIISNTISNGIKELPFLPIPVRVDSLEDGKSKTRFGSRSGGLVPEYLVYDPKSGDAAIPDGALELMDDEDNKVDNGGEFVNKYAGKGKAFRKGGKGATIDIK